MIIKLNHLGTAVGKCITIRCPSCGNIGSFEAITNIPDLWNSVNALGHRRCPNPVCHAHVFCILDSSGNVLKSYPPQRIDFNPKRIPSRIVKTFAEALSCHAESLHIAAAMMIRRTLEELCEDKKATGGTLNDRIKSLQSLVILPKELFAALDDLRLLGNDAAHIEAKTYDSIGPEEIEVAIALTKEVLKAVYQLDDLVARLKALKKP